MAIRLSSYEPSKSADSNPQREEAEQKTQNATNYPMSDAPKNQSIKTNVQHSVAYGLHF